jgi:hypothetical protein
VNTTNVQEEDWSFDRWPAPPPNIRCPYVSERTSGTLSVPLQTKKEAAGDDQSSGEEGCVDGQSDTVVVELAIMLALVLGLASAAFGANGLKLTGNVSRGSCFAGC